MARSRHEQTRVTREQERELEHLSPFELKARLIDLAEGRDRQAARTLLNAGRGNPNWTAIPPREAFLLLGRFALQEARRDWDEFPQLGGMPARDGSAGRLGEFLDTHHAEPGAGLLGRALTHGVERLGFDPDAFVHELADAAVGDHYPEPDRMLHHAEQVVHAYLVQEMCAGQAPRGRYDLFATEGGTAAMCYVFDSLMNNRLLHKGDRIAIMAPIFTPYLEIPRLERYAFDVVELQATRQTEDGFHTWQYADSEIDKLADPSVKLVCLVNPSNPPSMMLAPASMERIAAITRTANPGLVIVTDDVYGTFVKGRFRSLMAVAPRNTIGVYSFSKYFGCTGWRLGVIAIHQDNVLDAKLAELPRPEAEALDERYGTITLEPGTLRFIDRMVADSRQVALNHTAGLSLPQQLQMTLFAMSGLLDADEGGTYKQTVQEILARRLRALSQGTGVGLPTDPLRAGYYVELDLLKWAERHWGRDFAEFMRASYEPVDPVFRLAEESGVVLLNGGGFDAPEWSVRVSLANLAQDDYERIGHWLAQVAREYLARYQAARGTGPSA